jgi:hypothetical protein
MTAEIVRSLVVDATPDGPVEQRLDAALQIANEHKGSLVAVCPAWPTGMSFADALVRGPFQSMAREEEMRQAIALREQHSIAWRKAPQSRPIGATALLILPSSCASTACWPTSSS